MEHFTLGKYFGTNKNELSLNGILLSETVYNEGSSSDWHYHDNSYFAFSLSGGCVEKRGKSTHELTPGKLFFYNKEEPHRNEKYQSGSRIFNIELSNTWFKEMDIDNIASKGIITVNNPDLKFLLLKLFQEYRLKDKSSHVSIEALAVQLVSALYDHEKPAFNVPVWVNKLNEILQDCWQENFSLKELSVILERHPVTISKNFPKYFNCTLGEYLRKIRIDKSLSLIRMGNNNLTNVALTCGFADQSHFTRVFKKVTGLLPHHYKAL